MAKKIIEIADPKLRIILSNQIRNALGYLGGQLSQSRKKSIEYYLGDKLGTEIDGRSQVVSTDVSDTVESILPNLLRIFTASDKVVRCDPVTAEDVPLADQATAYINHVFYKDNNGFQLLYNFFKDALLEKNGILKIYYDKIQKVEYETYQNLTQAEKDALNDTQDEIEVVEETITVDEKAKQNFEKQIESLQQQGLNTEEVQTPNFNLYNCKIKRTNTKGSIKVQSVPPEEFLIDRDATSMNDAYCIAHRRYLTVSDLVEMGYDYDDVQKFASPYETQLDDNAEYQARNTYQNEGINPVEDDANLKVQYVEAYMKIDMTGDGIAELRRLCCVGDNYEIKKNLKCEQIPFVSFCPDPEPHTFFGLSIADITEDIQKVKSMVMRSMLDSLALSVHPRVAVVEGQANIEDVMNTEVGGIIRQRNAGAVQPFNMPFVGKDCFPMLNYLDEVKENRTGISKASMGLDPDALQSSTASAVNATIQGGQQHIELIARIFAETGMKPLFKGIYELLARHQDKERTVRLRNEWIPIDPRVWQTGMDCVVNVGLGNGTAQERMQYLGQIASKQEQILQTLGASNPLVEMTQYRNTMAKMVELAGFKDPSMFFKEVPEMTPEQRQAMMQQKPDVSEQLLQVQIKEIEANMQKANARLQLDNEEMKRKDDLDRDKLDAEIMLKAAEIEAKYGTQVETTVIRALVERDREQMKGQ